MSIEARITEQIRDIADFPKPGILFKDITPLLNDPVLCSDIVDAFVEKIPVDLDAIACVEARGFFFGTLLAQRLQIPFVPIRKAGKLPYKTVSYEYALEYGTATVEMHDDAIQEGWNVLVHDDLLATGGTAAAAAELIQTRGTVAGFSFLVDLTFLGGKNKLSAYSSNITALVEY